MFGIYHLGIMFYFKSCQNIEIKKYHKFLSSRSILLPVATNYSVQYLLMLSGLVGTCKCVVLLDMVQFIIILNQWLFFLFSRELLISFRKATGQKPLRIIFYRYCISINFVFFYLISFAQVLLISFLTSNFQRWSK